MDRNINPDDTWCPV